MPPLRVIFAGSGEFGLPTLDALRSLGHELVLVVSQPDRPAGRGKQLTPTPVAHRAADSSLPLLRTDDINCEELPDADVMIVIAFGQKISDAVVQRPRLGSINLHASRLPNTAGPRRSTGRSSGAKRSPGIPSSAWRSAWTRAPFSVNPS